MYTKIQVVFDAADPAKLASFWKLALGYDYEPPPEGYATWEDFGHAIGLVSPLRRWPATGPRLPLRGQRGPV